MIASVPSEPMSKRVKSSPTTPFVVLLPVEMVFPAPVTALSCNVLSRVVPYLTARGPAALHARLPPIVQNSALLGSGGQKNFFSCKKFCNVRLVIPVSTLTLRLPGLKAIILSMRSIDKTTPPMMGTEAPVVPVPRPRVVNGILY